jgi:hypothetical protein
VTADARSGCEHRVPDGRRKPAEAAAEADPFTAWRERLAGLLGPAARRIEHVGSTSVPGLAAKPIVDIQVSVADLADEDRYAPPCEARREREATYAPANNGNVTRAGHFCCPPRHRRPGCPRLAGRPWSRPSLPPAALPRDHRSAGGSFHGGGSRLAACPDASPLGNAA